MPLYQKGLLALSADPITYGHLDLVRRAGERCDLLLVMVSSNPDKGYVLKAEERLKLTTKVVADFCPEINVTVFLTEDIMTDVFLKQGCDVVFRGARDVQDVEYEALQTTYHNLVLPGIADKTVILAADPNLVHIQSTAIRHFARKHLDVTSMVPVAVQARLWRRMHSQKVLGITGNSGVGLTTVAQGIQKILVANSLPCTIIDLAELAVAVKKDTSPGCVALQAKLAAGTVFLGVDPEAQAVWLCLLNQAYREAISKVEGIVLVVGFELLEYELLHWVNNNILRITSHTYPQSNTLVYGGDSEEADILGQQQKDCYGTFIEYENDLDKDAADCFTGLGVQICNLIRAGTI